MVQLNPILRDLLMREAHVRLYRERLEPVWSREDAALRALVTTRPRFIPFFSRKRRAEYEARVAAARKHVDYLRGGLDVVESIEPHVRHQIEVQLDVHLSEHSAPYIQAREALGLKADWDKAVEAFTAKVALLVRALDNMRNGARSSEAIESFRLAIDAAKAVTDAAHTANGLAEEQMRAYLAGELAMRPLPRLAETDHAVELQRVRSMATADALTHLTKFVEQMESLHTAGVAELCRVAAEVEDVQRRQVHGLLLMAWEQFRTEVAPEIFAGDTHHVVTETAEMALAESH